LTILRQLTKVSFQQVLPSKNFETDTFTKVVTQMVQFLSDTGTGDTLVAYDDALEQELAFNEG
jgi:hypothetical protein